MNDHDPALNPAPNAVLTRRDLLAAGFGAASLTAAASALAQPEMPTTSRELWQWVRTQPVFDLQLSYLDVASAGPTLRAGMAAEYRARESQSFGVAGSLVDRWTTESTRIT